MDMPVCLDAEAQACYNMINLTVIERRVRKFEVADVCGLKALACATINTKEMTCVITMRKKLSTSNPEYIHELNHCYGWQHGDHRKKVRYGAGRVIKSAYDQPWTPFTWVPETMYPPGDS